MVRNQDRGGFVKKKQSYATKVIIVCLLLLVLFVFSSCAALFMQLGEVDVPAGNVAVIPIHGVILTSGSAFGTQVVTADEMVILLEKARKDRTIKAVILEINSPGGSPVASDEIGQAVQELRAANKTVVAWIREVGASGGYWIAANTDHIVANRMSITGSIGVTGSYFGFEEFIDEHNITYRRLVSGEKKDIGSPFRDMSEEERKFIEEKLDSIHWFFVDEVARNRNIPFEDVEALATGEYFLGFEALEAGLIDELGGYDEAITYIEETRGIKADPFVLESKKGFFDELMNIKVQMSMPLAQSELSLR